jgi:transcriptional regulator with XRE-family HTH domain
MGFAENLKACRTKAGLSQPQLAQAASVPIDSLRRWEQGKNVPGVDVARRLADAIGVTLDVLTADNDGDEEPKKPGRKKGK